MRSISVIIPMYNDQDWIEKAVQSALIQEEVLQVAIVDDGSSDRSVSLVDKIAEAEPRVKLITSLSHQNRGSAWARNHGISQANGKYISFLDADDYYLENRFSKPIEILEKDLSIDGTYGKMKNMMVD